MRKPTVTSLTKDLTLTQSLLAETIRQRNEALGSLAKANQTVSRLEAEVALAKQHMLGVMAQCGYALEPLSLLLQKLGRNGA